MNRMIMKNYYTIITHVCSILNSLQEDIHVFILNELHNLKYGIFTSTTQDNALQHALVCILMLLWDY